MLSKMRTNSHFSFFVFRNFALVQLSKSFQKLNMINCDDTDPIESTSIAVVIDGNSNTMAQSVKPRKKTRSRRKTISISSPDANPWTNIFAQSKLVVSIETRNPANCQIMIHFAQTDFFENFGYSTAQFPMPLSSLYGNATIRYNAHRLQNSILMSKDSSEYQNLYKENGCALSCHISCVAMTGIRANPPSAQLLEPNELEDRSVKWSVLTIRSASVVGNTMHSGIGVMGLDSIAPEVLQTQLESASHHADAMKALKKNSGRISKKQ